MKAEAKSSRSKRVEELFWASWPWVWVRVWAHLVLSIQKRPTDRPTMAEDGWLYCRLTRYRPFKGWKEVKDRFNSIWPADLQCLCLFPVHSLPLSLFLSLPPVLSFSFRVELIIGPKRQTMDKRSFSFPCSSQSFLWVSARPSVHPSIRQGISFIYPLLAPVCLSFRPFFRSKVLSFGRRDPSPSSFRRFSALISHPKHRTKDRYGMSEPAHCTLGLRMQESIARTYMHMDPGV